MTVRFKDDIPEAKTRVEAWWRRENIDRACVQIHSRRDAPILEVPTVEAKDLHHYWTDPEVVLPRLLNEMGSTGFLGEAFPVLYPVPGRIVSITCKYLGAPNVYVDDETTWSAPIIDDWDEAPDLTWNPGNEWWRLTVRNMEAAAAIIRNRELECFLGIPDLNGPTEVLSGLRNPEKLCLDLILEADKVKEAARKVQDAWTIAWKETTAIASAFGGCFTWMGLWSDLPTPDLQSDFSSLISPEMFAEFILPFIREQAETFPRSIFHLDGPDMVRHLDLLLAIDEIDAIQWVQGAGAGPVSDWMDVMKRIQEGGKSLYIYAEPWEAEKLLRGLDPAGLMLVFPQILDEYEAVDMVETVGRFS